MITPSTMIDTAQYFEVDTFNHIWIKGHRIGLEDIIDEYNEGYTPEEIIKKFSGLELKAVYAVIAYYLHNRCDVDTYIDQLAAKAKVEHNKWERSRSSASLRVEQVLKERQHPYSTPQSQ